MFFEDLKQCKSNLNTNLFSHTANISRGIPVLCDGTRTSIVRPANESQIVVTHAISVTRGRDTTT